MEGDMTIATLLNSYSTYVHTASVPFITR